MRVTAIVVVLAALPANSFFQTQNPSSAAAVVEQYYDDLDFRRWDAAYDSLDPITKPDWELWRLQVSVRGGMLASYTKLDSLDVQVVEQITPDRVIVQASLNYLTALNWYPIERKHNMVRRDGHWYIEPDTTEVSVPPDQLARRSGVDYVIQGRRRVTSGNTELTDVQDRPELFLKSADLVYVEKSEQEQTEQDDAVANQPIIVGEVTNLDVDPGDITITGVLRDDDDNIIGRYNATEEILHTLRPRESTPFMIRFEEVAAGQNLDFDPFEYTPLSIEGDGVHKAEVYAKGVVTTGGLYRGLGVNNAEVSKNANGSFQLKGELRNDGVLEAVIPRVLVSFLDESGRVMWVQNEYLEYSIRSQRSGSFSFQLDDVGPVQRSDIPVFEYHNGIAPTLGELGQLPKLIDAPQGQPYASIRLDLSTFVDSQ